MTKAKIQRGMLGMVLALGITFIGCDDGSGDRFINDITFGVVSAYSQAWGGFAEQDTSTTGTIMIRFVPTLGVYAAGGNIINTATVSVDDLNWLTTAVVSFTYTGPGERTLTLNSITREADGIGVAVILNVTRAAPGSAENRRTATISINIPSHFEERYDRIIPGTLTFEF